MAIIVDWDEKCGEATFEEHFKGEETRTYTLDLYVGNCFLVMIHEFINEDGAIERNLSAFFFDEEHMKRCLDDGLFKKEYSKLTKISINKAKCRYYKEITSLLIREFDDLEIEIFTEGEKTWREYKEPQPTIPDVRMREIAEEAMSFLHDNDMIEDFLDDRGFDLDDKEKYYFGISFDDEEI